MNFNDPNGPVILGVDVYSVATLLAGIAALMVLLALYAVHHLARSDDQTRQGAQRPS